VKIIQQRSLIVIMAIAFLTSACQPLLEEPLEAQVPGLIHTLAVQTMAADQALSQLLHTPTQSPTQALPSPTPTSQPGSATAASLPTYTPLPTLTPSGDRHAPDTIQQPTSPTDSAPERATSIPIIQATAEPQEQQPVWLKGEKDPSSASGDAGNPVNEDGKYCNQVQFVQDVTIPDETPVQPGEEFTKIWQVKNIGTCTWTHDYSLIVVWGDDMGTRPPVPLGQVVQPGEVTDISIDMKAPYLPACYFTYWMMVDNQGNKFGTGSIAKGNFWVSVSVTVPYLDKYFRFG